MGCVSSKLFKKDLQQELILNNGGDYVNHIVSLTSSTYGALKLDNDQQQHQKQQLQPQQSLISVKEIFVDVKKQSKKSSPAREGHEVINAWELMEGLEEQGGSNNGIPSKKSPRPRVFLRGIGDLDSPLKFFSQIASPRKVKKGKENKGIGEGLKKSDYMSPKPVLKTCNSSEKLRKMSPMVRTCPNVNWVERKTDSNDSRVVVSRRSLGPLFDPELVASYEKELSKGEEHIKMMVSSTPKPRKSKSSRDDGAMLLEKFEKKCPPGGENAVIIYTTTLRGIRKTFEDCNNVRSVVESHEVQVFERDVSMDSGFKEELRTLMSTKEVKVPLVFVKGRLIGGAEQVTKMDEEGTLGSLFDGIPKTLGGCIGCAGVRFVMCAECSGSCKVLDEDGKKTVKCSECNENGLIHCPICC